MRSGLSSFRNPQDAGGLSLLLFGRLWVEVLVCTRPPDRTKNDKDLKFYAHTRLDHIDHYSSKGSTGRQVSPFDKNFFLQILHHKGHTHILTKIREKIVY